jgi:hypothetical protein
MAKNFSCIPLFSVAAALDDTSDFWLLQTQSEQDESRDLLGSEYQKEARQRWHRIFAQAQELAQVHDDARIELLHYRADLKLHGFAAAISRLAQWHQDLSQSIDLLATPPMLAEKTLVVLREVMCYFFGDLHLSELRQSHLHPDLDANLNALFRATPHLTAERGGAAEQRLREQLMAWLPKQHMLIPQLKAARGLMSQLEEWLRQNNALGLDIRSDPVKTWFSAIEELLCRHGAPVESGEETEENTNAAVNNAGGELSVLERNHIRELTFESLRRDDVLLLLRGLCRWYEVNEPTNPGPYFLERAARTMNANFLSVLQDLLPESAPQFEKLAGLSSKK